MLKSYIAESVEIRSSSVHGRGMCAKKKINKGEVVFVKGGYILSKEQLFTSTEINSYLPIDDMLFIGAISKTEEEDIKLYINHSCVPNCGLRGDITFIAINDIEADEELTCDYAFIDNEEYSFECKCGKNECRKIITGKDWMIKRLQEKYFKYFACYLKEKILTLNKLN